MCVYVCLTHFYTLQGTPLCAAISANNADISRFLISRPDCDVNAKDYDNEPPLCLAIRKRHTPLVKMLIDQPSCDVNKVCINIFPTPFKYSDLPGKYFE